MKSKLNIFCDCVIKPVEEMVKKKRKEYKEEEEKEKELEQYEDLLYQKYLELENLMEEEENKHYTKNDLDGKN